MPLPLIHYLYPSGLSKYQHQNSRGENNWALVTGASDGIGRALCFELSTRGFNVILHGRNPTKLARVVEELQAAQPNRSFRTVIADASSFTSADIERIAASVADVPLTILINNAGGTGPLQTKANTTGFKNFEDTTPEQMQALFALNTLFPMQLTRALLPQLQNQKKPTLVLTCGSQALVGQAYVCAYSACKGALHTWNRALAAEQAHAKTQVDITEVVIGATYTQAFYEDKNFSPGLFMPTAEKMARNILDRVGNGHRSVMAYFWHDLQTGLLYGLMPMSVVDGLVADVIGKSVGGKDK